MRNLKRVLSLALALVMVLGMMVITTSAADFTDADEITYKEAVEVLNAIGVIEGYNGEFNPKGNLNRAGAAKLIAYMTMGAEADNYLTGSAATFSDVEGHWAAKYIAYCSNLKIINGNGDGTFNPDGNISTVGFGKLVLGAVGIEGTYTGEGWEDNVKKALEDNGLDVVDIDTTDITREEAAALMLAGMKVPTIVSGTYWKLTVSATESYKFDTQNDALLYKVLLDGAGTITGPHKDASGSLLEKVYDVTYAPDTDDFGRPGDAYTWGTGANAVEMFYADEYVAAFEGPVAEKDIFAAAGVKSATTTQITYTLIEDGSDAHGTFTADKEIKNVNNQAKWTAAGTGEGIKSELYKEVVGQTTYYTLVAVREYMGTVSVTDATEDDDRYINVELDILSTGYESTKISANYETEEFEDDDRVLVTVTWSANGPKIQSIAYPETVEGKITKVANGKYTINGTEYVTSQNAYDATLSIGTEGKWYVDSMGNIINDVATQAPAAVYAYVIDIAKETTQEDIFATATDVYYAKLLKADGTVEVVPTTEGDETKENKVVTLTDGTGRDKGKTVLAIVGGVGNNKTITKGQVLNTSLTSTYVMNDKTVYVVETIDNNNVSTYTVYTGVTNVPTLTAAKVGVVNNGTAFTLVYAMNATLAEDPEASKGVIYLGVASDPVQEVIGNSNVTYYTYTAIVDGEITTLTATVNTLGGKMYKELVLDDNGMIIAEGAQIMSGNGIAYVQNATVNTAAKDGVIKIGGTNYLYNDATVVYKVAGNGAISATTIDKVAASATVDFYTTQGVVTMIVVE